jgi:hypothetical protein
VRNQPTAHRDAEREAELVRHVGAAQTLLDRHEAHLVQALAELGSVDLPDDTATPQDAALVEPLGPFYLAYQLELAGLLHTAETIAGLFASGAINTSLGPTEQLIRSFWQNRHNRLTQAERVELFSRVFEEPHFDRLLGAVMQSLAAHTDNSVLPDLQEGMALEQNARALIAYVAERSSGMTSYAAKDIVEAINQAVHFMRDTRLQSAFAVHGLWALVRVAAGGGAAPPVEQHLDLGKSGQRVLAWLAGAARSGSFRLDPAMPDFAALTGAAQSWLMAAQELPSTPPTAPTAEPVAAVA